MPNRPPTKLLALVVACLALAAAGCGSSSSSSSASASGTADTTTTGHTSLAKTKFVLHAGLAFGAFHRYIYKPFRAGDFSHPFSHKLTLVKAGLAAAFIDHELKLALQDAQSSPTLSKLLSPITALDARLHGLSGELKNGNTGAVAQDNGSISSIEGQSAGSGTPIQEQSPSSL